MSPQPRRVGREWAAHRSSSLPSTMWTRISWIERIYDLGGEQTFSVFCAAGEQDGRLSKKFLRTLRASQSRTREKHADQSAPNPLDPPNPRFRFRVFGRDLSTRARKRISRIPRISNAKSARHRNPRREYESRGFRGHRMQIRAPENSRQPQGLKPTPDTCRIGSPPATSQARAEFLRRARAVDRAVNKW